MITTGTIRRVGANLKTGLRDGHRFAVEVAVPGKPSFAFAIPEEVEVGQEIVVMVEDDAGIAGNFFYFVHTEA